MPLKSLLLRGSILGLIWTLLKETILESFDAAQKLQILSIRSIEGENPSIGIILCKSKKRTVVEYALKDATKPINVSSYHLVKKLPKKLKDELPSPEQIAMLLDHIR